MTVRINEIIEIGRNSIFTNSNFLEFWNFKLKLINLLIQFNFKRNPHEYSVATNIYLRPYGKYNK